MLEIVVCDEVRNLAKELSSEVQKNYSNNKDSIRKGLGHYYAKIGELVVCNQYGWNHANTFDYDIEAGNNKIEVKVKERSVKPRPNFLATVAAANTRQKCTHYLFCSTIKDKVCYIIGAITKEDFLKKATFRKLGEIDHDSPSNQVWTFKADCYNLPYSELLTIGETIML